MIAEEFEAHWSRLSFEGRRLILEAALEEICTELGLPTPELRFVPGTGFLGYDEHGNERMVHGTTDNAKPFPITIHYQSRIPDEGDRELLDDPWEILNTVYHEFVHYSFLATGKDETKEFNLKPGEHAWQVYFRADQLANQFYDDLDRGRRTGQNRFRLVEGAPDDFDNPAQPINGRREPAPVYHRPSDPTDAGTSQPIIQHVTPTSALPFGPFGVPAEDTGRSRMGEEMQRQIEQGWERLRRERENTPPAPPMPHEAEGRLFDADPFRHRPPEQHRFPGDLSGGGSGHMPPPQPDPPRTPDPPLEPIPRPEHPQHHHHEPAPRPPEPPREPPISPVINVS